MFLSFRIRECKSCGDIQRTIFDLDDKIAKLSTAVYNHHVYMAAKKCDTRKLKDLIYYRGILTRLAINPDFYSKYKFADILSKVKTLI